eukprot:363189-Chlamydomonas_euryale.AAC.2
MGRLRTPEILEQTFVWGGRHFPGTGPCMPCPTLGHAPRPPSTVPRARLRDSGTRDIPQRTCGTRDVPPHLVGD